MTASGNAVLLGPPWGPSQDVDIGGAATYFWDASFYSQLQTLLDPEAQREALLRFNGLNFSTTYGVECDTLTLTGHFYAYNAVSLFNLFAGYIKVTNDTTLLGEVYQYMEQLADKWRGFTNASSSFPLLADWSADPDAYLEAVPTYIHATAGLQAAAAAMSFELGDLLEAQGDAAGAAARRSTAAAVANASVAALYVAQTGGAAVAPAAGAAGAGAAAGAAATSLPGDVGGWFSVLEVATGATTEVRHVIDTIYAAAGFCGGAGARPAAWGCALSAAQRAQMADFARRQLIVPGGAWVRALSPLDALRNVSRPDHGTTGAYDSWPPLLFEALTALDGGFGASVPYLAGVAGVARDGPFGQAHEVAADNSTVFKTASGWTRYTANNGASFAEVVLRTLFGYAPAWLPEAGAPLAPPAYANAPRGVNGTLYGIRLPSGAHINAVLTAGGVRFDAV